MVEFVGFLAVFRCDERLCLLVFCECEANFRHWWKLRRGLFSVAVFRQHYARGVVDGRPRVGGQDSSLKRGGVSLYPPFVARGAQFATPSKGAATASHGAGVPFCALVVVGRFSVVKVSRNRTQTEQFGFGLCRHFNSLQCNRAETEQQTEQN